MKILIVARKYNDIFYAQSLLDHYQGAEVCLLFFGDPQNLEGAKWLPSFKQKIFIANPRFLPTLFTLVVKQIGRYDLVMLSNVDLLHNKLVMRRAKAIIQLEDGLMNYGNYTPPMTPRKKVVECVLGVSKVKERITHTYLLRPWLATYAHGKVKQLKLTHLLESNLKLDHKRIFVGQNLYHFGHCTIDEYCNMVNQLVQREQIDYYIPHAFADKGEQIACPLLNIWESKQTLEMIAPNIGEGVSLYSFNSTILFTVKLLNGSVQSVAIKDKRLKLTYPPILTESVDRLITVNCSGITG